MSVVYTPSFEAVVRPLFEVGEADGEEVTAAVYTVVRPSFEVGKADGEAAMYTLDAVMRPPIETDGEGDGSGISMVSHSLPHPLQST